MGDPGHVSSLPCPINPALAVLPLDTNSMRSHATENRNIFQVAMISQ